MFKTIPVRCGPHGKHNAFLTVASAVVFVFTLTACEWFSSRPVRLGILVWPPYELAFLAREKGFLHGANIELVDFESPAVAQRAYRDGVIDGVIMTIDYVLELAAQEPGHKIALVVDFSDGGDALVARADIDSLEQLRGKRIGVESSALGAYMLRRALDHASLTTADVEVVSTDIPDQARSFLVDKVDAVVTYEPTRTRLLEAGANELFSSRQIPGEIVDVLIARKKTLDEREKDFQVFVTGWMRALDLLREQPATVAEIVAPREGMTAKQFLDSLQGVRILDAAANVKMLDGEMPALLATLKRHEAAMIAIGTLNRAVDINSVFEPRFVLAAAQP